MNIFPLREMLIVDDHDIFRNSLKSLLHMGNMANEINIAENGIDFLQKINHSLPNIVLMDIEMPEMNGIEATRLAIKKNPNINILVLSMFGEERYYAELIEAGAKGFILKSSKKAELENAIKEVAQGNSYFSNDLLRNIIAKMGNYQTAPKTKQKLISFSKREVEIMQLMCQGLSTSQIAERILLSAKTVENYRVKLLAKTNCKNAVSLIVYAIKNKIIEI